MPREYEDYRDNIAYLHSLYPQRATLTIAEAAELITCDERTLKADKDFPICSIGRRLSVPIVGFAKWLSAHNGGKSAHR